MSLPPPLHSDLDCLTCIRLFNVYLTVLNVPYSLDAALTVLYVGGGGASGGDGRAVERAGRARRQQLPPDVSTAPPYALTLTVLHVSDCFMCT